jgi:xanthine dehydrogenase accessory factor
MSPWLQNLLDLLSAGTPVVRMAVADVRGSAPREPGASLLYWRDAAGALHSSGSVGGGNLEMRAMEIAQYLLQTTAQSDGGRQGSSRGRRVEPFTLGASLGQCCGGVVEMYWERFDVPEQACALARVAATCATRQILRYCALDGSDREWLVTPEELACEGLPAPRFSGRAGLEHVGPVRYFVERLDDDTRSLWIYGAGHVGRALVHVLADLPFCVTWVDGREEMLAQAYADLPGSRRNGISPIAEEPHEACLEAPALAWHLVITHNHDEDLRTCEALLARGQFGFLGMIGSHTKSARFRRRLLDKGFGDETVARLQCPIGVDGIHDKRPAAIAIAVAGQLLRHHEALAGQDPVAASAPAHAFLRHLVRHD